MKKKLLNIAVFLLLLFGVVGGTAAYYVNQGTVNNVITAGNVKADLHIWADLAMTEEFKDVEGITPGQDITKVVTAENVGDNEAWIRIWVDKRFEAFEDENQEAAEGQLPRVVLDIDRKNWLESNGWYYYRHKLLPGDTTKPLFTTVALQEEIDNSWQNGQLIMEITMHAVQVANNGDTVMEAAGWPNT